MSVLDSPPLPQPPSMPEYLAPFLVKPMRTSRFSNEKQNSETRENYQVFFFIKIVTPPVIAFRFFGVLGNQATNPPFSLRQATEKILSSLFLRITSSVRSRFRIQPSSVFPFPLGVFYLFSAIFRESPLARIASLSRSFSGCQSRTLIFPAV